MRAYTLGFRWAGSNVVRNLWVPHAPCAARRLVTLGSEAAATSDTAPFSFRPVLHPQINDRCFSIARFLIGFRPNNVHAYWLLQLPLQSGTTSRNSEEVHPTQREQRCGWFRLTGRPKLLHIWAIPETCSFRPK